MVYWENYVKRFLWLYALRLWKDWISLFGNKIVMQKKTKTKFSFSGKKTKQNKNKTLAKIT